MNTIHIMFTNSQTEQNILIVHIIINKKLNESLIFFLNLINSNSFIEIVHQLTF
jgi:hypothetical protein